MQKPLVSVIVPVYNVEEYLEECFLSIKNQTYENIEIILVNDGSTDDSGKLADSLAKGDKRVAVIHKKNGGLSDARNIGIKKAQGEYITFVDSDDYIANEFVAVMIEAAIGEGADIVQADNSRKPGDIGNGTMRLRSLSGADAFGELMKYRTISPTAWGKIYKISLFTDNDIDFPVGRIHEDTAILYRLIYVAKKITCLDHTLYYYRMNANSIMTANYTTKHYGSVVQYSEELLAFVADRKIRIEEKVLHKHMALRYLSVLNRIALSGNRRNQAYADIKNRFMIHVKQTHDPTCLAYIIPAQAPVIFIAMSSLTPLLRRVAGKT